MNTFITNNYFQTKIPAFKSSGKKENFASPLDKKNNFMSNANSRDVLIDKNYASLQVKKTNKTAFKGLPKPSRSVGENVGNLFNIVKTNDVIVASSNLKNGIRDLEKNIKSFGTVIKRIFFVEDKSLNDTLAFRKRLEDKEVINLSDNYIFIKDSKNKMVPLKTGEAGYLLPTDKIKVGEKEIKISNKKEIELPIKDSISRFINLEEEVAPSILELNKKSLRKIQAEQTKKPIKNPVMFSDVGGQDSVIKALKRNILFPIKHPELDNPNKSILLYGPPGTGKSLIAEATANESGAWYRKINASELDSKYVGESEANWRNLFEEARQNQPAIIFVDEFDAIAKKRGGQDVYGDKTLNTILGLMSDSEKSGDDIYMIAATNNRKALDAAATRSGRFGISLEVAAPDKEGIKQILDIHIKKQPLDKKFDAEKVVEKLHKENATGADIAAISADAKNNALEREHIYEKMEQGTYTSKDMDNLRIKNEDYDLAIENFRKSKDTKKPANPVGYNSSLYKN